MKRPVLSVVCTALVFWLVGCQNGLVLPPEVAGTWKADDSAWRIVLSPKGKVVSAIIPTGDVEVRPNKTTKVEMKDGSISTYKAGDFVVDYNVQARELFVSIVMEKIVIRFMDELIEGTTEDHFFGVVSEDGRIWQADRVGIFDYGPRLPQDANDILPTPVTFKKIEASALAPTQ